MHSTSVWMSSLAAAAAGGWFAATMRGGGLSFDSLAHIDLRTRSRTVFELPENMLNEPGFAAIEKSGALAICP